MQTTDVTSSQGLSTVEARRLRDKYGPNVLPESRGTPLWLRFMRQFKSPLIYVLLFALVLDLGIWFYEGAEKLPIESIAIALMLALNAGLGTYQESKAEAALAKLSAMVTSLAWVLRDGTYTHRSTEALVPGDLIRVEAGDRIPADGLMLDGQGVLVDESMLTGESLPVDKAIDDEVYCGTLIVRGNSYIEVTKTGAHSSMGRLATLISELTEEKTPLERQLHKIGNQIAVAILGLAVLLVIGGIFIEGFDRIGHIFLFAVVVAVAAIPEGLPAVLTLTLALGVERMAKKKAVVRRLSAVEALGAVTVIATDKTGTLTENRMLVKAVDTEQPAKLIRATILVNDADISAGSGDPLELALLEYAQANGADPLSIAQEFPRSDSKPFDSSYMYMRATVTENGADVRYFKGAPEALLALSKMPTEERAVWESKALSYGNEGYKVLAVATSDNQTDVDIDFLGLVLLWDPPRAGVTDALAKAQAAGIRVLMITGDHPATARAIAGIVGIPDEKIMTGDEAEALSFDELKIQITTVSIFARATPEHKLRLVEALKESGEVVAVTGDGVNDAPALKRADVGVAMGQRGSDVSREVADIVLLDDNFATIVTAIEEGRNIYENIQKFIRFLFSTNFGLVVFILGGLIIAYLLDLEEPTGGLLLPLTAAQLLWVNVISDGPAAMSLAMDRNSGVMSQKPRDPKSPLLDGPSLRFILFTGMTKAAMSLSLLLILPLIGYGVILTRTAVFLYDSIAELLFAYPARHISVAPKRNVWLNVAITGGIGIQLLTAFVPQLRTLLGLEMPDSFVFFILGIAILISWAIAEGIGTFNRANSKK
jgi:Ca2+-transporting ATPase